MFMQYIQYDYEVDFSYDTNVFNQNLLFVI